MRSPESIGLLLVALIFAVYFQVRHHDFVDYHDYRYILQNPNLADGFGVASVKAAFTRPYYANWIPLTSISLQIDYDRYGFEPAGYLLTNAALHAVASVLLFLALVRMTAAIGPSAFVAAVFAVHPLHVESVAWASQRKDVLAGVFWMLTLYTYARYAERSGDKKRYALVCASLTLGLLAKPLLVTLPFVLLLLDYWPLKRLRRDPARLLPEATLLRRAFVEKIPLLLLVAAVSVITLLVQEEGGAMRGSQLPLAARAMNALESYVLYIRDSLWPAKLAVFYPHPTAALDAGRSVAIAAALAAVTALVARAGTVRPYLAVGWLWYLGTLVPMIGIVQVGIQARADRYMYIPLIGLAIMVAWGAAEVAARRPAAKIPLAAVGSAAVLALAAASFFQVQHWRDTIALFERAIAVTDENFLAHRRLGAAYGNRGDLEKAAAHYREALRIHPEMAVARIEFGNVLEKEGDLEGALDQLEQGIRENPDHLPDPINARALLGTVYLRLGRDAEAYDQLTRAVAGGRDEAELHAAVAVAAERLGRPEESIRHNRAALARKGDLLAAANNLAWTLATHPRADLRDPEEAIRIAEVAVAKTRASEPSLLDTLAAAYAAAGRFEDAVRIESRAAQLVSADPARQGRYRERLERYQAGQPYLSGD